uniref:HIT-type domain-containing protein n=1 Tax=Kalanchoe fedtschenkoi TaxID=63787 RepID=A0A7N0VIB9_KALFE
MTAALQSSDNRAQAALALLDALEKDNTGLETVEANEDDEDDLGNTQKKQLKATKRKTRQVKALENTRKAPRSFLELLHEANLESLPPHRSFLSNGYCWPPSSTSRRHFCTMCGFTASYTCLRCGMRFWSCRCQNIHNDSCCLKFVA